METKFAQLKVSNFSGIGAMFCGGELGSACPLAGMDFVQPLADYFIVRQDLRPEGPRLRRNSDCSNMSDNWCTIESDPGRSIIHRIQFIFSGVFTELISDLGVSGIQVEELYSLDEGVFDELPTVYGLIFLFKWIPGTKDDRQTCDPYDVYFARQVITNACATQAILSILMNGQGLSLGETLTNFKSNTAEFDAEVNSSFSFRNSFLVQRPCHRK